jgi:hypothetical protein
MPRGLASALFEYRSGLERELGLLGELLDLATRQRDRLQAGDLPALPALVEARARVMDALSAIEQRVRPLRDTIAQRIEDARRLPGFDALVRLHREAEGLVTAIQLADRTVLHDLETAGVARREALLALETGEATLAAYRKVLAPTPGSATIVDQHG